MGLQSITAACIFAALVVAPFASRITASFDNPWAKSGNETRESGGGAVYHPKPVGLGDAQHSSPPDFSNYALPVQKKMAFYDYFLPMVHKANEEVILDRQWLIAMTKRLAEGKQLSETQLAGLNQFEERYLIRHPSNLTATRLNELLQRVDVVPASLIIAQAAKESGWGTSRFATEGNNFFGIRCFYRGCGLIPRYHDTGRYHESATFTTVQQGIRYYVRTINTHIAYDGLRRMRMVARRNEKSLLGIDLANGLERYSERGMAYVREVQFMIRSNKMQQFSKGYLGLTSV